MVDDGSTDDTPDRVCQFDGRITSVRKPNAGQASALTAGSAGDLTRMKRMLACSSLARVEVQKLLERQGFPRDHAGVQVLLERMRLVNERIQFGIFVPGRRRFFAHLRASHRLYGRNWSARYRAFESLKCAGALLLGYRGFRAFQKRYRSSGSLVRGREALLPVLQRSPS